MTNTASTDHVKAAIQQQEEPQPPRELSPYRKVEQTLEQLRPQILKALPNTGITPDRLSRIALTTIKMNPALLNCESESLFASIMQAAQLGLTPNLLGSCYFIPYKDTKNNRHIVQFQIGYRGLIDLVTRSGQVVTIKANVVHENDVFEYEYGLNEKLRHVPARNERGAVTFVYAYALLKSGGHSFEVMSIEDIYKIRDSFSAAYKGAKKYNTQSSSIWVKHFDSMAKKTVIKQLIKYLPISTDLHEQVSYDETVKDSFEDEPHYIDLEEWQEVAGEEPAEEGAAANENQ
jgi:recombination protein RecT